MRYFLVFMTIWIAGCAIADFAFELGADSWRMMWGYIVASLGEWLGNKATAQTNS